MTVQMINQRFQFKNDYATGYDLNRGGDFDHWTTTYITDIPIATPTSAAKTAILGYVHENIDPHLNANDGYSLTLERNCLLGYWQFTVVTFSELTIGLPSFPTNAL